MALKFIHARCSEKGTANGAKGDTYNEVGITSAYNHKLGWLQLTSFDPILIDWVIYYAKKLANNDCIGYGQIDRLSLYNELVKVNWVVDNLKVKCNCDCSSFVRVCIILALKRMGKDTNIPNFTTANEKMALLGTGLFYVCTDPKINKCIKVTKTKGHTVIQYDDTYDDITKKTVHEIALEVIKGVYGNGITRIKNLEKLGYDFTEVQTEVNKILKG